MAPIVLAYNLPGPVHQSLGRLCDGQGVSLRRVADVDQGKTIGALLGLPLPAVQMGNRPGTVPGEMLVLSGFSAGALDALLDGFGDAGVPPIPLKAVVTAQNLAWTGVELYAQLDRERRATQR